MFRTFLPDGRLPPVNGALRKPSIVPPKALKRPKLDELDLFQLGLNVKEQLAHNALLGQNYDARPPWCDAPDDDDEEEEEDDEEEEGNDANDDDDEVSSAST